MNGIFVVFDATFSVKESIPGCMNQKARLVIYICISWFSITYMTRQRRGYIYCDLEIGIVCVVSILNMSPIKHVVSC